MIRFIASCSGLKMERPWRQEVSKCSILCVRVYVCVCVLCVCCVCVCVVCVCVLCVRARLQEIGKRGGQRVVKSDRERQGSTVKETYYRSKRDLL